MSIIFCRIVDQYCRFLIAPNDFGRFAYILLYYLYVCHSVGKIYTHFKTYFVIPHQLCAALSSISIKDTFDCCSGKSTYQNFSNTRSTTCDKYILALDLYIPSVFLSCYIFEPTLTQSNHQRYRCWQMITHFDLNGSGMITTNDFLQ